MTSDANLIRPPKSTDRWSIGIYAGRSPFDLNPAPAVVNPVLNAGDVTDVDAAFVADPFMIREDGYWHMFFEVLNREHQRGEIGWATSPDGISWSYQRIVLREPYHLSYPHVFRWQGAWFMIPETLGANGIQLYQATRFPTEWRSVAVLVSGQFADPTIFRYRGRWWLFACPRPYGHDALSLFLARDLSGPWIEHPQSPIIDGDRSTARPAGRVTEFPNRVVRYAQDCLPEYGSQVRAFEISRLDETTYVERQAPRSPILTAGETGWNRFGMHHLDLHQLSEREWIACVDGKGQD